MKGNNGPSILRGDCSVVGNVGAIPTLETNAGISRRPSRKYLVAPMTATGSQHAAVVLVKSVKKGSGMLK